MHARMNRFSMADAQFGEKKTELTPCSLQMAYLQYVVNKINQKKGQKRTICAKVIIRRTIRIPKGKNQVDIKNKKKTPTR